LVVFIADCFSGALLKREAKPLLFSVLTLTGFYLSEPDLAETRLE
jgi:hypothetical protein